jgi:serine/threonine protein kinase
VNINSSQKEKLLKSMSSYKDMKKISNLNSPKGKNTNIKSYRKQLNNLSINLSKDLPSSSLNNFDIDDYNIVKSIGEGTFGKIFEVEDKYHRHFAMKKLICNSIKEIETLKKEYEFLYNFENLNINLVRIYGIETKKLDRTTFVMYVLMELAKTDWEKAIIKRKKINNYYSEEELINILKDLTLTLSQLQKNNISHRDIKPQNILLCEGDILKISDFGEAKENINNNYDDTIKQTIRGTELYMSPILFKSLKQKIKTKYTKHNTYKSDVFSLGYCILLAASLNFDCLYSIRELHDMVLIKKKITKYIKERYSDKFLNIILAMLEIEEKNRPDFIQLEKILDEI